MLLDIVVADVEDSRVRDLGFARQNLFGANPGRRRVIAWSEVGKKAMLVRASIQH